MPLIAVTRLRLRSLRYLPLFGWLAFRAQGQARRSPGHLGSRVLNDVQRTYWTMSAWENEHAMRAFTASGPHRRAMPWLRRICDEASVVHWLQDTADLPDWNAAHRRMAADGRRSLVDHPSADHLAGAIARPVL